MKVTFGREPVEMLFCNILDLQVFFYLGTPFLKIPKIDGYNAISISSTDHYDKGTYEWFDWSTEVDKIVDRLELEV